MGRSEELKEKKIEFDSHDNRREGPRKIDSNILNTCFDCRVTPHRFVLQSFWSYRNPIIGLPALHTWKENDLVANKTKFQKTQL